MHEQDAAKPEQLEIILFEELIYKILKVIYVGKDIKRDEFVELNQASFKKQIDFSVIDRENNEVFLIESKYPKKGGHFRALVNFTRLVSNFKLSPNVKEIFFVIISVPVTPRILSKIDRLLG